MAENIQEEVTKEVSVSDKHFTKKELNNIWLRWGFTHLSSMSYEKIQGHSWAFAYSKIADKYYSDKPDEKKKLLLRHSMFYNTEPQTGQLINGIVTSLEEQIAFGQGLDESLPVNIKTALMGPLAGIGDSLIQGIIVPLLLSIGMGLAQGGNPIGPIFYIISYAIVGVLISRTSYYYGYKLGVNAIDAIVGEGAKRITDAFNILGVIVVGGLSATMITLNTTVSIPMGEEVQSLQEVLDGIFPQLLPLIIVILTWWLIAKKQWSGTKIILLLTAIVTVGAIIGIL